MPPGPVRFKDGAQPLNLAADQARVIHYHGVTQIRLRPAPMADRITEGSLVWLREPWAMMPWADHLARPPRSIAATDAPIGPETFISWPMDLSTLDSA